MQENNNIDDLFRSAIEPYRAEPSAAGKEAFFAALARKRSARVRRRRWGLFSASILLVLLSFTAYKFFSSSNDLSQVRRIENSSTPKKENPIDAQVKSETSMEAITNKNTQTRNPIGATSITGQTNSPANPAYSNAITPAKSTLLSSPEPVTRKTVTAALVTKSTGNETKKSFDSTNETRVNSPDPAEEVLKKSARVSTPAEITENTITRELQNPLPVSGSVTRIDKETTSRINPAEEERIVKDGLEESPEFITENAAAPLEKLSGITPANPTPPVSTGIKNETAGSPENSDAGVPGSNSADAALPMAQASGNEETSDAKTTPAVQPVVAANTDSTSDYLPSTNPESRASLLKKIFSRMSAEIYFSPDYVKNRLASNNSYTGTASKNPADYSGQNSDFSYSTGLHIGVDVSSKWTILSGISFSTFSQSSVYNTIQIVADSVYKVQHEPDGHGHGHGHGQGNNHPPPNSNNDHHYVVHTPCGSIDLHNEPPPQFGNTNPQNGESLNIKTEVSETIHFVYVPLIVRYQFGKGKFSFLAEGGGAINFVSKDMIHVTVNDSYQESNNLDGLNNINYSLLLGAGVKYNFYRGLSTFLKPSLRYSVTPINDSNPIYSYPYYLGIGAGLSIHF
jgi:hypothetical protein